MSLIEGQLDPEDPGNVLKGQLEITNYDLSTTTVTWNIVHAGPIRLPVADRSGTDPSASVG